MPLPEWVVKLVPILDTISGWTFLAFTIAAGILLFSPFTAGVDLTGIRNTYGGWLFVILVFSGVFVAAKIVRSLVSKSKPKKSFILTGRPMHCWWNAAEQKDGSYVTQLVADCDVLNLLPRGLKFHAVALDKPKVKEGDILYRKIGLFNEATTGKNYILPAETEWVRLSIMVRGKLGKKGKALKVRISIIDSVGVRQRLPLQLRPA